jgi:hypothetical protein
VFSCLNRSVFLNLGNCHMTMYFQRS